MIKKNVDLAESCGFTMLAFSLFVLMFAMRPVTLLPTLIILGCPRNPYGADEVYGVDINPGVVC